MKRLLIAATALAGVTAGASPALAAQTVLDFSGSAACEAGACDTGGAIAQSYGDGAGVDVSYATFTFTGQPTVLDLRYWGAGYGDLLGVIWGGTNQMDYISRITLTALPGYEISLLSFDIATFQGQSESSPVLIESLVGAASSPATSPPSTLSTTKLRWAAPISPMGSS